MHNGGNGSEDTSCVDPSIRSIWLDGITFGSLGNDRGDGKPAHDGGHLLLEGGFGGAMPSLDMGERFQFPIECFDTPARGVDLQDVSSEMA